jgi:hypothetical protein
MDVLDRHLLLALRAVFFQRRHLRGEGPSQFVERPLSAVLLRDVLDMRQAVGESHRGRVDCGHLRRQHRLDLVAWLDALDDREHEIRPTLRERVLPPACVGEVAHQAVLEVNVHCSDRPHQGEDSDCFVGMIDAEFGRCSVCLHFQTRPACFARSFEFGERLFFPRGQLVWRLLSSCRGTGSGLVVGVAGFVFRASDQWFYSSFHFGARKALGTVSVGATLRGSGQAASARYAARYKARGQRLRSRTCCLWDPTTETS